MRSYITLSVFLILAVFTLAILIKYPPYQKQQPITVKENMSLRHIAERNDIPLQSLVSLLDSEDRRNYLTTFKNIHKPLQNQNLEKERIIHHLKLTFDAERPPPPRCV
jgi:hypothetical protein